MQVIGVYEDENGEEKEIGPEQEKRITKRMMEAAAYIYNYELNWKGEMKTIGGDIA